MSNGDTDRKKKIAQVCFAKATEAMGKENWDYAIEMWGQAAQLVPDNVVFRQNLRGCEYRKYKNNNTGASMAGMRLMGIRSKVKKARSAQNWSEMDHAAEEGLSVNPWDGQLNADLGEASIQLENFDVALFAYQSASKAEPKNKAFLKGLARAMEGKKDFIGASKIWQKIYDMDPMDSEARSNISHALSKATIHQSGLDNADTTHEVAQGYEQSVKGDAGDESIGPGDSPEEDLKRKIRKDPGNKEHYQRLADILRRETRLQEAFELYMKAHEISGDVVVREQAEDVRLDILRKNLDLAKETVQRLPDDPKAKENVAALANELLKQEIETWSRRTERYPNDLKLKYELAQRFFRAAKYSLATKYLQQASKDIRIEGPVLLLLGKCFLKERQNNLAQRQFEKAVEKFNPADQPGEFVECHYLLGRLCKEAKRLDDAERHFTEVLAVDYDYRDTRQQLEEIQGQRGDAAGPSIDI